MKDTLEELIINKLMWPLLAAMGGGMLSRLWIGIVFRAEVKKQGNGFKGIQEGFEALVWNERLPVGSTSSYRNIPYLG